MSRADCRKRPWGLAAAKVSRKIFAEGRFKESAALAEEFAAAVKEAQK